MIPSCQFVGRDRTKSPCGAPASHLFGSYPICFDHVQDANESEPDADPCTPIFPYEGMPATCTSNSDRYPCTVYRVSKSAAKIVVRGDKAIRTDSNGMSEDQEYRFEPDPEGDLRTFWRSGAGYGKRGSVLILGVRRAYYDYSF